MKPDLFTVTLSLFGVAWLTAFALLAFILRSRGTEERWWRCTSCRNFFSSFGHVRDGAPDTGDGVVLHGFCPHCRREANRMKNPFADKHNKESKAI